MICAIYVLRKSQDRKSDLRASAIVKQLDADDVTCIA
jgi:hypothetical protein